VVNSGDAVTVASTGADATLAGLTTTLFGEVTPWVKWLDGTGYPFDYTYHDQTSNQVISSLGFLLGDYAQVPPAFISTLYPNEALSYRGISYVFGQQYQIDSSATIPQIQVASAAFLNATCPLNNSTLVLFTRTAPYANIVFHISCAEADPALCMNDLLTNAVYGAGFPSAFIDPGNFSSPNAQLPGIGDASWQTYCQAVGFGFSISLDNTESCASILQRWADLTNTAIVWTGLLLKFIPYGDLPVSDNPNYVVQNPLSIPLKYYVPNTIPLFSLTDDDFQQSTNPKDDPVVVTRKDIVDKYNTVRLSFRDRTNAYTSNVVEAKDENAIDLHGIRVDNMSDAKEFPLAAYAGISAQLRVQRNVSIDRTFKFKLPWTWCFLEPMDIIALTEPNIGLKGQPVRIITIEEDDKFVLSIEAEILLLGSATAISYERQPSAPSQSLFIGAAPSLVFRPFIFEPTSQMLTAESQPNATIVIGATGGIANTVDPQWGGAYVYIGIGASPSAYEPLGTINGPSRMGVLTGALTAGSTSIPVDLSESGTTLETVSATIASNFVTLCALTDSGYTKLELFAYTTATLTSTGHYTLTGLYRALYGTTAHSWSNGDLFLRIDTGTFQLALPPQYVGTTLSLKLLSFNIQGQTTDTLASATQYTYDPSGHGFSAQTILISGNVPGRPGAGANVFTYAFQQTVTLKAGLAGSSGVASGAGATSAATFNIYRGIGSTFTSIGTMVFAAGGTMGQTATFTFLSDVTFNAGDSLTLTAPTPQDATLANVSWTFEGNVS
jgi:hypothetical protein